MHETIERNCFSVSYGEVPLVTGPGFALPTNTGGAPGAGFPEHIALNIFFLGAGQAHGLRVFQGHLDSQRRTKAAQGGDGCSSFCRVRSLFVLTLAWGLR